LLTPELRARLAREALSSTQRERLSLLTPELRVELVDTKQSAHSDQGVKERAHSDHRYERARTKIMGK